MESSTVTLTTDEIKPSKHPFVSFWTQRLQVRDEETRAKVARIAQSGGNGVGMTLISFFSAVHLALPLSIWATQAQHPEIVALLAGTWGVGIYGMWRYAPRHWLLKMDKSPVTATEIESFLPAARGNLERQYLSLALDVLRVKVPTEAIKTEIQDSLAALGEAVMALPGDPPTHGATAVVYKNTLLQVSHLRDVIATFDTGLNAAIGANATGAAALSIDRLTAEASSLALAHKELNDELGADLLATLTHGMPPMQEPTALPTVPETLVPTPKAVVDPPMQTVGNGNNSSSGTGSQSKWWQGRSG